jgi:signal transduction histidine kinase
MQRYEKILNPRHAIVAVAVGVAIALVLFALDMFLGARTKILYPTLYTFPLLASLWMRDRRYLWMAAVLMCAMSMIPLAYHHYPADEAHLFRFRVMNRALICFELLMTALVMHVLIRVWVVAERRREETFEEHRRLEESHEELAAREEEISRQNDELQSQTEELERQSEELRVANDELSRRERMLESLLSLSRALSAELSSDEAMSRICASLGHLINGAALASAILEKDGDDLVIRCHHGFSSAGLKHDRIPYAHSFASLVIERGQSGYLEDVTVRPDLQFPQTASGQACGAILAAPLKVGRRTVGSLEVYAPQPRSWSSEQVALVESLAAQTSISLETAALFEEVQQQRRRLQSVLQTVPIGISILSEDGNELEMNPAASMMLGLPVARPLGPSDLARFGYYQGGVPLAPEQTPLFRALRNGIESHGVELDVVLPGPEARRLTLLVGASPVRDAHGKIDGAVAAFADITAQKNLQRDLDARRREAEEVSVRKTRFLAAVSLDIRTPANAIGLLGELLQRATGNPAMAAELPELAKDLNRSALSLVNLVSDVLELTRKDTGKVELLESEFDLDAVVTEECRQLQPLARQKGLIFTCHPSASATLVRADRMKLARVLGNLIGNAIKYTQSGSVDVRTTRLEDGRISISVADTGPGIAHEHLDLIFDEFFQLRNPERDSSKGSGLGLSISKRLVNAMGGTLVVQSKPGAGSTFVVTLPASAVVVAGVGRMPTSIAAMSVVKNSAEAVGGNGDPAENGNGDGNGQENSG